MSNFLIDYDNFVWKSYINGISNIDLTDLPGMNSTILHKLQENGIESFVNLIGYCLLHFRQNTKDNHLKIINDLFVVKMEINYKSAVYIYVQTAIIIDCKFPGYFDTDIVNEYLETIL